jgi:hypothetical protein
MVVAFSLRKMLLSLKKQFIWSEKKKTKNLKYFLTSVESTKSMEIVVKSIFVIN